MNLQLVGCSHHNSRIEVRERLAFSPQQVRDALALLRQRFPESEAVLLSTCNRVELYTATEDANDAVPTHQQLMQFLADFHGLQVGEIESELFKRTREDAVRHLFQVSASLDSMVMGEAQILSQVKSAYETATDSGCAGPLTHAAFQSALRVARRVTNETAIHEKRISIPSVAVGDFASQIFETFEDKLILVIGAGEMGRETLQYLIDQGAQRVVIVNRNRERAEELAAEFNGQVESWDSMDQLLVKADLIVSTTGATEPIVTLNRYRAIEPQRYQRTLFVLDLGVPRDFESGVGDCLGVYLYSIDDLQATCDVNRKARAKDLPKAEKIVEEETTRFLADWNRRVTAPTIRRLRQQAEELKQAEMSRLMNRLEDLDERSKREIQQSLDRLVNKLLHPPLDSIRHEAEQGTNEGLLDALKRLFQLRD